MPSHSQAQHLLMEAVLHNPEVSKRTGIPAEVARDFVEADSRDSLHTKKTGRIKAACLLERCARRIV